MKKINYLLIVWLSLCFGCASVETSAYRVTGTIALSVDKAMSAWGDYVRAGKATPGDEDRVKTAYEKYQLALRVEQRLIITYKANPDKKGLDAAINLISASSSELVTLINSFLHPG